MIKSFKNKGLAEIWEKGSTAKINSKFYKRIEARLTSLEAALKAEDMNIAGYNFHPLNGYDPTRYSVHINGPWCITFEFEGGDAYRVDFEQYH